MKTLLESIQEVNERYIKGKRYRFKDLDVDQKKMYKQAEKIYNFDFKYGKDQEALDIACIEWFEVSKDAPVEMKSDDTIELEILKDFPEAGLEGKIMLWVDKNGITWSWNNDDKIWEEY